MWTGNRRRAHDWAEVPVNVQTPSGAVPIQDHMAQARDNDAMLSSAATATGTVAAPVSEWLLDEGGAGYSRSGSGWIDYNTAGHQGDLDFVRTPTGGNRAWWNFARPRRAPVPLP